ncbi:hypothetical protein CLV56_0422 [Mumia flava]|uniref:HTH-type transcriptional regulator MT1864/Rv1816-like C-terminal domain-containing protein n=1 Tax=Mumia flava TaxID=1348852 RepID=A0A0B2BLF8_9ACTN|nr:TetR/AcrR family transcriptional regulator [Mumia flava]PJJ56218.1 hypothetical protein CLV56_0422 [Mumia flava]
MTTAPTRRETQRQATLDEIVVTARRMVAGGEEISLRAVATAMGMTAPALYRYVDNIEDLSQRVAGSVYDDLLDLMLEASGPYAPDPASEIVAGAAAFRRWSLAHRGEFALTFANPVIGASASKHGEGPCAESGMRFGGFFGERVAQLWSERGFSDLPAAPSGPADAEAIAAVHEKPGVGELPERAQWAFLRAWSRLYGTVTLETFGHVSDGVVESGALFQDTMRECGRLLGLGDRADELQVVVDAVLSA